jgi:hypothetical protein
LEKVFHFLGGLENDYLTSTASRLGTVQREIENLEAHLNPDLSKRAAYLHKRIEAFLVAGSYREASSQPASYRALIYRLGKIPLVPR